MLQNSRLKNKLFSIMILFSIFSTSVFADNSKVVWISQPKLESLGDSTFQVDAQAWISRNAKDILAEARDYDSYVAKKVPSVVESHVVLENKNSMKVWFHTSVDAISSMYYMDVHFSDLPARGEVSGGYNMSWNLSSSQANSPYSTNDALDQLYGSLRLETIQDRTRVTYHLIIKPNTIMPDFAVKLVLNSALKNEASYLFQIMANSSSAIKNN